MTLQRLIASEVRRKAKRCDSAQAIPPKVRWSSKWTKFPSFDEDGASAGMKLRKSENLVFQIYLCQTKQTNSRATEVSERFGVGCT